MRLIDVDAFSARLDECSRRGGEQNKTVIKAIKFLLETEAVFYPVEAIPVEWIEKNYPRMMAVMYLIKEWRECNNGKNTDSNDQS